MTDVTVVTIENLYYDILKYIVNHLEFYDLINISKVNLFFYKFITNNEFEHCIQYNKKLKAAEEISNFYTKFNQTTRVYVEDDYINNSRKYFTNYDCSKLNLKDYDLKNLSHCTQLNLSKTCYNITPNNFQYLTRLRNLTMRNFNCHINRKLNEVCENINFSLILTYLANNNFKLHSLDLSDNKLSEQNLQDISKIECDKLILINCEFSVLLKKHPNVRTLNVSGIQVPLYYYMSNTIVKTFDLKNLVGVTNLNISYCKDITIGFEYLTQLKKLNISGCTNVKFLPPLTKMLNLNLGGCDKSILTSLYVPNCTKLDLSWCNLNDDNLFYIQNLQNLTDLDLSCNELLTSSGIQYLTNLNKLNKLVLTQCTNIDNDCLKYLSGIPILNLSSCIKINNSELKHLSSCYDLNIDHCKLISDLSHFSNIFKLSIIDCPLIINDELLHLNNCICLDVRGCSKVTSEIIYVLKRKHIQVIC